MKLAGFCDGSVVATTPNVINARCINMYPEPLPFMEPGKGQEFHLVPSEGLTLFGDYGGSVMRGLYPFGGKMYVVIDNGLYSIDPLGAISDLIGSLATSIGRVSMADNGLTPTGGNELAIADGTGIYILNISTGVFTANVSTLAHDVVKFADGRFVANIASSAEWTVSALYDGLTWDGLAVSTADAYPDLLNSIMINHRELWLLGEYSTEVWSNVGASHNPYQRVDGVLIDHGIHAKWSAVNLDNTIFWLARNIDGKCYAVRANGYSIQQISNSGLEDIWNKYPTAEDAFGYGYTTNGHAFWVLTFPSGNATWVFDSATQRWHERSRYTDSPDKINRHQGNVYCFFLNRHMVGDFQSGKLYILDSTKYTDNGVTIVRERITGIERSGRQILRHIRFELEMQRGVGLDGSLTALGVDPQVELSWSNDYGASWSAGYTRPIGKIGEKNKRIRWTSLGSARDRIYRVRVTDPVPVYIYGADLDIEAGRK